MTTNTKLKPRHNITAYPCIACRTSIPVASMLKCPVCHQDGICPKCWPKHQCQ